MATMNVSLPDQMKEWVEDQVATGRYANASDYVRDLVRKDQLHVDAVNTLQKIVDDALASGISTRTPEELMQYARESAERFIEERDGTKKVARGR